MSCLINNTGYSNGTTYIPPESECQCYPVATTIWTYAVIICFVIGFPGAVVVLLEMFQKRRKGTPFAPTDIYTLNLTVMDVLYLLLLQPDIFIGPNWRGTWYAAFLSFMHTFNMCGRPLFITCISLECYLAVVHPAIYRTRKSLTPRCLMAVGVWTMTVGFGFYFAIRDINVSDFIPILLLIFTLSVIVFCDFSTLWTLKRPGPGGRNSNPLKTRALRIIINNFIVTLITYLPVTITWVLFQCMNWDELTFSCKVMIPATCFNVAGNTVSIMLQVNNLGKLDSMKNCMQKFTSGSLCFVF